VNNANQMDSRVAIILSILQHIPHFSFKLFPELNCYLQPVITAPLTVSRDKRRAVGNSGTQFLFTSFDLRKQNNLLMIRASPISKFTIQGECNQIILSNFEILIQ
jgi:hypothetical protein